MYRSPNVVKMIESKRLRWEDHRVRMKEGRTAFKILTGRPIGKKPLGRPRRRCEDNNRIDLKAIGMNTRNWVHSA